MINGHSHGEFGSRLETAAAVQALPGGARARESDRGEEEDGLPVGPTDQRNKGEGERVRERERLADKPGPQGRD